MPRWTQLAQQGAASTCCTYTGERLFLSAPAATMGGALLKLNREEEPRGTALEPVSDELSDVTAYGQILSVL